MATSTKRLTQQEIKHERDPLVDFLQRTMTFVRAHRAMLLGSTIAAVVLVVAVVGGLRWRQGREAAANRDLAALLETYRAPAGVGAGGADAFDSEAAKDRALADKADGILSQHGSSRAARAAQLLKARALAHEGRYQEAEQMFAAAIGGSLPADALGAAAALSRASLQAAGGDPDGAVAELKRLAGAGGPYPPKDLALDRAAMIAENHGREQEALVLYQRLSSEATMPTIQSRAKAKADELSAKLREATPDPAAAATALEAADAEPAGDAAPGQDAGAAPNDEAGSAAPTDPPAAGGEPDSDG